MVRTASLFSQLLEQFPRHEFARLVSKHQAERDAKGFTCWAWACIAMDSPAAFSAYYSSSMESKPLCSCWALASGSGKIGSTCHPAPNTNNRLQARGRRPSPNCSPWLVGGGNIE